MPFQIVDPKSFWVETLVFDQLDPGTIAGASAETPDGQTMELKFQGRGRALQQQADRSRPLSGATRDNPGCIGRAPSKHELGEAH